MLQRLLGADGAAGQDQFERPAVADDARQTDRAEVDERDAETPVEDAKDRGARGDPEVAPKRELHPARDRGAFDRGDHRLSELEPRRAHRAEVAVRLDRPRLAFGERLEIGPGAERAPAPVSTATSAFGSASKRLEGVKQSARGRKVDRVAPFGPLDRHDRHALVGAGGNGHRGSPLAWRGLASNGSRDKR